MPPQEQRVPASGRHVQEASALAAQGRARPGDACTYEQAHKLSIDDYMVVQGWSPKYRGVLPAGDSKTARYRAVGLLANSVVPAVAEHAARSIVWAAGAAEPDERGAVGRQAASQAKPPGSERQPRSGSDGGHVGPGEHATSDEVRQAAKKAMQTLGQVGDAAHDIGIRMVKRAVYDEGRQWHAPRVVPELDVLAGRDQVVEAEGQATHVREVARREYKNLAKQFQDVWREDGTLRNLHRQKWWYEDADGVPPLASDVAGMMNADPGRFDVVDDAQPTHDCAVVYY